MSMRPRPNVTKQEPQLRVELDALRAQALAANAAHETEQEVIVKNFHSGLDSTEVAAASLGVDSTALKPLSFMNTAHYETLLKSNVLSDQLARRLEAYKTVAQKDGVC